MSAAWFSVLAGDLSSDGANPLGGPCRPQVESTSLCKLKRSRCLCSAASFGGKLTNFCAILPKSSD